MDASVPKPVAASHSARFPEPPFWGAFGTKWLDPAHVAGISIWLASTVAAPAVIQLIANEMPIYKRSILFAVMLTTGLLSLIMARMAPRAATRKQVVAWCLVGGILLGALNTGLCMALATLMNGGPVLDAALMMLLGSTVGAVAGGPIGFGFGLAFLYPALCSHRIRSRRSCASGEQMLVHAGGWLIVSAAVVALCQLAVRRPVALWLCLGIAVLGGAATLAGFALRARRRQWLVRIASGNVERWSVRDSDDGDDVAALPLFFSSERSGSRVVVHEGAACRGPYRSEPVVTPVARC